MTISRGEFVRSVTATWRRAKRKLERTREGHRQSDEHGNRFKGNVGETSERRGGAYMGFSERIETIFIADRHRTCDRTQSRRWE